jgi:hypothetical protein
VVSSFAPNTLPDLWKCSRYQARHPREHCQSWSFIQCYQHVS